MDESGFVHLHCSSRYDRDTLTISLDIGAWMQLADIITITNGYRPDPTLPYQFYEARADDLRDNALIVWDPDVWHRRAGVTRMIMNSAYSLYKNIVVASVLLYSPLHDKTVLVSTSAIPPFVEGLGYRREVDAWLARKSAYMGALRGWSTYLQSIISELKPDGVLVAGDWNLNLKHDWVRDTLSGVWGEGYTQGWTEFPTAGQTLRGGPVAPTSGPGKGNQDRIIDGVMLKSMQVTKGPALGPAIINGEHRPHYQVLTWGEPEDTYYSGDVAAGEAWWGFGDHMDDELYEQSYIGVL